jgi:hypothetical protein
VQPFGREYKIFRFLNFELLLRNNGTTELHLNPIQISVYDNSGKLA